MEYGERRRDHRFVVCLKGALVQGRIPLLIENAAYRGVLVRTRASIALGQLGQLGVALPDEGPVVLHGVPVRVGPPEPGGIRALGFRLIGLEQKWEDFVRGLHCASGRVIKVAATVAPLPGVREAS